MNKRNAGILAGFTLAAVVVALSPAAEAVSKPAPPAKVVAAKTVRTVTLAFPASAKVATNVTGSIQVLDITGPTSVPVAGVMVALQEKRGNTFTTVADDVTDENGSVSVAFVSRANATYRPLLEPAVGPAMAGKAVVVTSEAVVNWAARPDLDVTHGVAASYAFRVASVGVGSGSLEIAKASAPTKWTKVKTKTVVTDDVVTQLVAFPAAGQWLLRGSSLPTATNAAGHTTTLPVTVR